MLLMRDEQNRRARRVPDAPRGMATLPTRPRRRLRAEPHERDATAVPLASRLRPHPGRANGALRLAMNEEQRSEVSRAGATSAWSRPSNRDRTDSHRGRK